MEIYQKDSDTVLTVIQGVYVGFDASSSTARRVPDEVRELIGHFEASGEVLPMSRFPKLAEAAQ